MRAPPFPDSALRIGPPVSAAEGVKMQIELRTRSPAFLLWFVRVAIGEARERGIPLWHPLFLLEVARALWGFLC